MVVGQPNWTSDAGLELLAQCGLPVKTLRASWTEQLDRYGDEKAAVAWGTSNAAEHWKVKLNEMPCLLFFLPGVPNQPVRLPLSPRLEGKPRALRMLSDVLLKALSSLTITEQLDGKGDRSSSATMQRLQLLVDGLGMSLSHQLLSLAEEGRITNHIQRKILAYLAIRPSERVLVGPIATAVGCKSKRCYDHLAALKNRALIENKPRRGYRITESGQANAG
jgi:hypothetical protein